MYRLARTGRGSAQAHRRGAILGPGCSTRAERGMVRLPHSAAVQVAAARGAPVVSVPRLRIRALAFLPGETLVVGVARERVEAIDAVLPGVEALHGEVLGVLEVADGAGERRVAFADDEPV